MLRPRTKPISVDIYPMYVPSNRWNQCSTFPVTKKAIVKNVCRPRTASNALLKRSLNIPSRLVLELFRVLGELSHFTNVAVLRLKSRIQFCIWNFFLLAHPKRAVKPALTEVEVSSVV